MQNNQNTISLANIPAGFRKLILGVTLLLTSGVTVGLLYLYDTTSLSTEGAVSRYRGDIVAGDIDIPEQYPKTATDLLLTTHNHLIGFSFIFAFICTIFYFSATLSSFWKHFFMVEPFLSVLLTFGSLWLMRFVHEDFIILTVLSALLTYLSYYFMTAIIWFEILAKNSNS